MNGTKRRRSIVAAVTAVIAVAALVGCATGGSTPHASSTANTKNYNLITPGTLTVAVTGGSKPIVYLDASGTNWIGFEPDLVKYAAKVAGIKKVVFIEQDFSSLLADVAARKYDIGAAGIGDTKEREQTVDFTSNYLAGYLVFIDNPSAGIKSLADVAGKRVGVVKGTVEDGFLQTQTPKALRVEFPDNNSAVQALVSGSVDTVFLDDGVAETYTKQHPQLIVSLKTEPKTGYAAWPIAKQNTALRLALNKGIAKAISSGYLESLYKKWLPGFDIFPQYLPKK